MSNNLPTVNVLGGIINIAPGNNFMPAYVQKNGGPISVFPNGIAGGPNGVSIHFNAQGIAYVIPNPPPPPPPPVAILGANGDDGTDSDSDADDV